MNHSVEESRKSFEAEYTKLLISEGSGEETVSFYFERGSNGDYNSVRVKGAWWGWESAEKIYEQQVGWLRGQISIYQNEYVKYSDFKSLQAQLDKAMGLLREHQWQWQPYDDHYHRDSGHRCVECGGYRDGSGHEEYCELGNFLNTSTEGKDHA